MIILTDIHGNFDTMMALLGMIPQEEKNKGIAICGDLIDRGPKSKQVIQYCIDNNVIVVRGNHEDMMVDESQRILNHILRTGHLPNMGSQGSIWTLNGGQEALESYIEVFENELDERGLPTRGFDFETFEEHVEWIKTLPYFIEFPDLKNDEGRYLVLSHTNIGPVWKLKDSTNPKEIQAFNGAISWGRPHKIPDVPEIYNVIGHTPQEFGARYRTTYANIDTGCFYTRGGYGRLTALQFPEMIFYEHENIDTKVGHNPIKKVLTIEDLKTQKKRNKVKP